MLRLGLCRSCTGEFPRTERPIRSLEPADLGKSITHPMAGQLSTRDLLHEWIHHDRNHTRQLLQIGQERAWPHMGNSQKFKGE